MAKVELARKENVKGEVYVDESFQFPVIQEEAWSICIARLFSFQETIWPFHATKST